MSTVVGFGTFSALPQEQINKKISRRILSGDQGMIVWFSIGAAPSCPDEKGHPLAPVVNLTVSTPKLKDKTPKLTRDGAKKGQSVQ
jgi:hypothetical protein